MTFDQIIGLRIRDRRTELGLSQAELAKKLGYSGKSMVSLIETGKRSLNASQIRPLAKALRSSITRYNHSRGVHRTGIHKFRHTFARMYLVECDGDPLRLQKILGHSTLEMTRHYAKLFDADIVKDRNTKSPLEKLRDPDRIRMK